MEYRKDIERRKIWINYNKNSEKFWNILCSFDT